MKKYVITFLALLLCIYVNGQDTTFSVVNPNNSAASISLNWLNDIARIRVGGSGVGAANGFSIQGVSDKVLLRLLQNGNIGVGISNPATSLHVNGTTTLQMRNNGGVVLRLETERPWEFRQMGSGAAAHLELFSTVDNKHFFINTTGGVGIGTTAIGSFKLAVNGAIRAEEIKVETGWADFVFEENYPLKPLAEVEAFIKENGHLPDIPSAEEVEENGVNVGEMEAKLLQKIEELTLYVIAQQKELEKLKHENKTQNEINTILLKEIKKLNGQNEDDKE